jgi:hypothetical protein
LDGQNEGEKMKGLLATVVCVTFMVGLAGLSVAGSIDSPGIPTVGSGMYTLQQIYDYLNSGTVASTPGMFQEPAEIPGPTMRTTKELYADIKAKMDLCTAGPGDVSSGVKFFCTQTGSWGVQTGIVE